MTTYEHPASSCRLAGHQEDSGNAPGAGPTCPLCGVRYWVQKEDAR